MKTQTSFLYDVVIIRPILIILLVFYHAFAIYSGAWEPICGFPEVKAYWWLDKLSYAFMLETFVFVSGYVFGYQVRTKGESKLDARNLFLVKFKRLLIPSMVFSLLYIILLMDIRQPITKTAYDVINGTAHMWFLPMLFWCFAGIWVIEKLKLPPRVVVPLLLLSSVFLYVSLPLQFNNAMYYMVFFYAGYYLQRNEVNIDRFVTAKYCCCFSAAFAILFPALTLLCANADEIVLNVWGNLSDNQLVAKVIYYIVLSVSKLLYSFVGLAALFLAVALVKKKCNSSLPLWLIRVGGLSMGVYIFQQFILKGLYVHTNLPVVAGPYWTPWISFMIALTASVLLSLLFRQTRVGRFLIG